MRHSSPRLIASTLLLLASPAALPAQDAASGAPPPYLVETAVAEARLRAGTVQVKRLEAERAAYAVKEARSRALPQLGLTASSTYMTDPPEGLRITQGAFGAAPQPGSEFPIFLPDQDYVLIEDTKHTYFRLNGTIDQVLWTWGKIRKAIEVAELDRQAAEVAVKASERELGRDVARSYFGAAVARDSASLLREAEALALEMVADREGSLAAGTVTRQDVLETRSQAGQIGSQRVRAEEGLQTALDGLEFYTGRRPDPASLASACRERLPDVTEERLVTSALAASAELQRLDLASRQARLAEEIRRASLMGLPDISLNVTLSVEGQDVPLVTGNWTDTWNTNLLVTIAGKVTLFDSLSSVWRLKQAQLQRKEADIGVSEMSRGTEITVRRLVEAARTDAAMVVEKRLNLEFARERARNATLSWEGGMISRAEERGARLASITAELELLLAKLQCETAILELELATGQTFPR